MTAITKLNFERDINGYNAFAPDFPSIIYTATLVTGPAVTLTIPESFEVWVMAISPQPGTNIWVSRNGTAAAPAGASFALAVSELNPTQRRVFGGDVISFLTTNATAAIEVALYAIS